mgnify:CR=1 FL=1
MPLRHGTRVYKIKSGDVGHGAVMLVVRVEARTRAEAVEQAANYLRRAAGAGWVLPPSGSVVSAGVKVHGAHLNERNAISWVNKDE